MQNNLETAKMLDLEVIPERALGGAQWELVLGEDRSTSSSPHSRLCL